MINKYFKREISNGSFIAEIDGLRAFALIMVFLFHLNGYLTYYSSVFVSNFATYLNPILKNGDRGVTLFFTISAFILALPMIKRIKNEERNNLNMGSYFLRRISRLQPSYIITLVIFGLAHLYFSHEPLSKLIKSFLYGNIYLHNIVTGQGNYINYVLWSLEIEFQFYLLLPIFINVIKLPSLLRRSIFLILIMSPLLLPSSLPFNLNLSIVKYYQYFVAGILLADLYTSKHLIIFKTISNWISIPLTLVSIFIIFINPTNTHWIEIILPINNTLLITLALLSGPIKSVFNQKPLVILGTASYTGYLIHFQIISLYFISTKALGLSLANPLFLGLSILALPFISYYITLICFILIEKPFMKPNWYKWNKEV